MKVNRYDKKNEVKYTRTSFFLARKIRKKWSGTCQRHFFHLRNDVAPDLVYDHLSFP